MVNPRLKQTRCGDGSIGLIGGNQGHEADGDLNWIFGLKMVALNYVTKTATLVMPDGEIVTFPDATMAMSDVVSRATFIPAEGRLEVVAAGEVFPMNLALGLDAEALPAVYLDQNHWIDFARWTKGDPNISGHKAEFFRLLDDGVMQNRIIVPLSSAHLIETSKRRGRSRMELAATMLRYTRGWQMRSVLQLRRGETRSLFGGSSLSRRDAITLDPEAILDMPGAELPNSTFADEEMVKQRLTWASTLVSLLLKDEPFDREGGIKAAAWASSFQPLADAMRGNDRARPHARNITRLRFINDMGTDVPAAAKELGVAEDEFARWFREEAEQAISSKPGLGRMREIMHLRLMNSDDKWESNDLNDWTHLSYAAAYCDLVLGERKTVNYLVRAKGNVTPGAIVHRRAADALSALERLILGRNEFPAAP